MSVWSKRDISVERGATYLEAIIVLPLLFLLMLGTIDLGRYVAIKGALTQGAQQACNQAAKMHEVGEDKDLASYDSAAMQVIQTAQYFPLNTGLVDHDNIGSFSHLLSYQVPPIPSSTSTTVRSTEAILLRPGEAFQRDDGLGNLLWQVHPTLCPADTTIACPSSSSRRKTSDTMEDLLAQHPLQCSLFARMRLVSIGFGSVNIEGKSIIYHEDYAQNAVPVVPPTHAPSATPSVSASVLPSPSGFATPTPIATPTSCSTAQARAFCFSLDMCPSGAPTCNCFECMGG